MQNSAEVIALRKETTVQITEEHKITLAVLYKSVNVVEYIKNCEESMLKSCMFGPSNRPIDLVCLNFLFCFNCYHFPRA